MAVKALLAHARPCSHQDPRHQPGHGDTTNGRLLPSGNRVLTPVELFLSHLRVKNSALRTRDTECRWQVANLRAAGTEEALRSTAMGKRIPSHLPAPSHHAFQGLIRNQRL